jgi:hypothetical protein
MRESGSAAKLTCAGDDASRFAIRKIKVSAFWRRLTATQDSSFVANLG